MRPSQVTDLLSKQHHRADERRYSATYQVEHGLVGELSGESLGKLIRWRVARVQTKEQEDEAANEQDYPNRFCLVHCIVHVKNVLGIWSADFARQAVKVRLRSI